jgi:hypothetical protein
MITPAPPTLEMDLGAPGSGADSRHPGSADSPRGEVDAAADGAAAALQLGAGGGEGTNEELDTQEEAEEEVEEEEQWEMVTPQRSRPPSE